MIERQAAVRRDELIDIEQILGITAAVSRTQLILDDTTTYEQWCRVGYILRFIEEGVHWWIGDWWRFGERHYGDMASQQARDEVENVTGYSYSTVVTDAWVASRFESSRRRENLSFAHHREVAALDDEHEQDTWLDQAAQERWSRNELRDRVRAGNDGTQARHCERALALMRELQEIDAEELARQADGTHTLAAQIEQTRAWLMRVYSMLPVEGHVR